MLKNREKLLIKAIMLESIKSRMRNDDVLNSAN